MGLATWNRNRAMRAAERAPKRIPLPPPPTARELELTAELDTAKARISTLETELRAERAKDAPAAPVRSAQADQHRGRR